MNDRPVSYVGMTAEHGPCPKSVTRSKAFWVRKNGPDAIEGAYGKQCVELASERAYVNDPE
jgi:hypothetical protein